MKPEPTVFVHDKALCESGDVGAGTTIWAFAHVMTGARIGEDCNICDQVFVESGAVIGDRVTVKNGVLIWDGVTIEDDVFVGPGVVFTNDPTPRREVRRPSSELVSTIVRKGGTLGANATIVCGVTVGEYSFVGAGSVVTRDVPPYALVVGNPARRMAWACECGRRIPSTMVCQCGRTYKLEEGQRVVRARGPSSPHDG